MFRCEQCHKEYSQEHNLKYHIQTIHEKTSSTLVCEWCTKDFPNALRLNKHVITIHENLIKYCCNECDKIFYDQGALKRHESYFKFLLKFKMSDDASQIV